MTAPKAMALVPKDAPVKVPEPTVKKAYVRTVQGEMVHLHTSVRFTTDPKKVEIDQFVQAQLDAGKLMLADD